MMNLGSQSWRGRGWERQWQRHVWRLPSLKSSSSPRPPSVSSSYSSSSSHFCYGTSIFDPTPSKKFLYQIGLKPTFDTGCGSFVVVTSLLWLSSKSQSSLPVQHSRRCQELEQFDFRLFSLFLFWREAKLLPPCWFNDNLNITDFNSDQIWEWEKKRSKRWGMLRHASTFFWKIIIWRFSSFRLEKKQ